MTPKVLEYKNKHRIRLKPCPNPNCCISGIFEMGAKPEHRFNYCGGWEHRYWVSCPSCGLEGPKTSTETHGKWAPGLASKAWNQLLRKTK